MSRLSERLKELFEETGITQYRLANSAGIDRTTLNKTLLGTRTPNIEFMRKLCDAMSLNQTVRSELLELAEIDRDGEVLYNQRREIKNIIEQMALIEAHETDSARSRRISVKVYTEGEDSPIQTFNDSYSVDIMLSDVINEEFYDRSKDKCKINLYCPTAYKALYSLLLRLSLIDENRMDIKHLIRLESRSATSPINNLKIVKDALPFAMSCCKGYTCYYTRCRYISFNETVTLYSCFAVIGSRLVLFSNDFSKAALINDEGMVSQYIGYFNSMLNEAIHLRTDHSSTMDLISHQDEVDMRIMNEDVSVLMSMPGVCHVFTSEQIVDHRRRELEGIDLIAKAVVERYELMHQYSDGKSSQYFTMSGLERFIETGYSCEIPSALAHPFTMEERVFFVEKCKELIENDQPFYIINENRMSVPLNFSTKHIKGKMLDVSIFDVSTDRQCSATLFEESIMVAVDEFFDYLKTSPFVYPKEEAVEILEKRLTELRRS